MIDRIITTGEGRNWKIKKRSQMMSPNEKDIRLYANHLALTIRRRGTRLELRERYADNGWQSKRLIGVYRSWRALEQAIDDYGEQVIARDE
jgi:hypothetical protein